MLPRPRRVHGTGEREAYRRGRLRLEVRSMPPRSCERAGRAGRRLSRSAPTTLGVTERRTHQPTAIGIVESAAQCRAADVKDEIHERRLQTEAAQPRSATSAARIRACFREVGIKATPTAELRIDQRLQNEGVLISPVPG